MDWSFLKRNRPPGDYSDHEVDYSASGCLVRAIQTLQSSGDAIHGGDPETIIEVALRVKADLQIDKSDVESSVIYQSSPNKERSEVQNYLRAIRSFMEAAVRKATEHQKSIGSSPENDIKRAHITDIEDDFNQALYYTQHLRKAIRKAA